MNVTIQARCFDGVRRKSLNPPIVRESVPFPDTSGKWHSRFNRPGVKAVVSFAIPIALLAHGFPPIGLTSAFAATVQPEAVPVLAIGDTAKEAILHAFDPLINLIQLLAYPIAGVMIAGGCLFVMVGNRERGMSLLQNAAIGYILMQLSPLFLQLLVGIGASV